MGRVRSGERLVPPGMKSAKATAETGIRMRLFSDGASSRYYAGATGTTKPLFE